MSGINEYLSKALNCSSPSEAASHLSQAESLLITSSDVRPSILPVLQKILKTHENKSFFPLLKFYNKLLDHFLNFSQTDQVQVIKDVVFFCDKLKDCKLSAQVIEKCEKIMKNFESHSVQHSELSVIFSLPASVDIKLQEIVENVKTSGELLYRQLNELMSDLPSVYLQCKFIETRFEGFLLTVEKHLKSDQMLSIIKFIENFVFKKKTFLDLESKTQEFCNFQSKSNLKLTKAYFKVLDLLVPFEVQVIQQALKFLQLLWEDEELEKEAIYDITKLLLSSVAREGDSEFQAIASAILYQVINSNVKKNFKYSLERDKTLRVLFESDFYRPFPMTPARPEDEIEQIASAVKLEIPAGRNSSYLVPVDKPGTLLVWGFVCLHYDIGFKVTNVDTGAVQVGETRVKCDETPETGQLLIKDPGLYELTWINSYSWLNSKQIKLRVQQFEAVVQVPAKKKCLIEVLNSSNHSSLIQIGVWRRSSSSEDKKFQVLRQGSTFFISSLTELYETLNLYPEGSRFAVGVVGPAPLYVPKLQVDALCTCQDSEALTFMGLSLYGPHTVVSVVVDGDTRLAVGCAKTLVYSAVATKGLAQEIGRLLDVFGPAFVLIAGDDIDLRALEKDVENFVCVEITQQSLFRLSNDLLMQAAGQLFSFADLVEGNKLK